MNILQVSDSIQQVAQLYLVEDEQELVSFLTKDSEVITLLIEAHKQIRKYFDQEKLVLKVTHYYELAEWEKLAILIFASVNNLDEAERKLQGLDENWWIDASSGVGMKLYIGLEFE